MPSRRTVSGSAGLGSEPSPFERRACWRRQDSTNLGYPAAVPLREVAGQELSGGVRLEVDRPRRGEHDEFTRHVTAGRDRRCHPASCSRRIEGGKVRSQHLQDRSVAFVEVAALAVEQKDLRMPESRR